MGIIKQWKTYIDWLHYKKLIEKQYKNVKKETEDINKDYNILVEKKNKLDELFELQNKVLEDENKKIYLTGKEMKKTPFHKVLYKIFKFDGYLLHGNKANNFKLYKIKNLKTIYDMKNKESYGIDEKIGTHKGKPLFLSKYPLPITLTIDDDGDLLYDAEAFHIYKNHATKRNLLARGEVKSLKDWIRENKMLLIIIAVMLMLMFTPEGQSIIKNMTGGT